MTSRKSDNCPLRKADDVVQARQLTRKFAIEAGLNLVDQTKIVTAASEIARNTIVYGGGGDLTLELVENQNRPGVRLIFEDQGPGIPDIEKALQDGYTTGNGLGLGLGGARRLASDFELTSQPGKGTRIVLTRWKNG